MVVTMTNKSHISDYEKLFHVTMRYYLSLRDR
jgi:hypothetical protein